MLNLSDKMIHVPPVYLAVCAEKVASFHKLEPPLNSINLAYLRLACSEILVSCSNRMSVGGVVCLKMSFNSFLFLLPMNLFPRPLTFWEAMMSFSPFMFDFENVLGGAGVLLAQNREAVG